MKIPDCVTERTEKYANKISKYSQKLADMYEKCYVNTIETALCPMDDGTMFVLTGDIPAMWLRDSTAEVSHYIPLAKENKEIRNIIKGVIKRQRYYISIDAYTNAFKKEPNSHREFDDYPIPNPIVWERKYEIDSLCYPIRLTYLYWKATGDDSVLDESFTCSAETIVNLWIKEQHHEENSNYRFIRNGDEKDTLKRDGLGTPLGYTGMTWSGFRPSDDACRYGYLVASNMFAATELLHLEEMLKHINYDSSFINKCINLKNEINEGINKFAIIDGIYACEVDGLGNYFRFDDANVPSLLSAPYLGYCSADDETYQKTRAFILSKENPYYYEGKFAKGVGSPHTPEGYIWHIALSMQGLTSTDKNEIKEILSMLENTDANTYLMHEGFDANDPNKYTRSWFSWSCALFSELCEKAVDEGII